MTDTFDRAFALVIGVEGGFTANPLDPGNWTGGRTNVGTCAGTKFGISAASYPTLDIASLTLADAETIYRHDYWAKIAGDSLPPPVALIVFDAAVNSGVDRAAKWLQTACGVTADGVIGDITLKAAAARSALGLVTECNVQRLLFLTGLPTWRTFGLGWARRVAHLSVAAVGFDTAGATMTLQTINPAPVVASLDDVRAAFREIQNEKAAA